MSSIIYPFRDMTDKSKIVANGVSSAYFICLNGVRQGEHLSPLLFSIFLNDLMLFTKDTASKWTHNKRQFIRNISFSKNPTSTLRR